MGNITLTFMLWKLYSLVSSELSNLGGYYWCENMYGMAVYYDKYHNNVIDIINYLFLNWLCVDTLHNAVWHVW